MQETENYIRIDLKEPLLNKAQFSTLLHTSCGIYQVVFSEKHDSMILVSYDDRATSVGAILSLIRALGYRPRLAF
ncbi:MAG: hypothetical protein HQL72_07155 [Magnetococcales bacterium]|nr:hypothetical protein [Magnetococcales bacterium]